jgi:hypothetical protein
MKNFVCESLDQFLSEWIDRGEDRWADREIDKYLKKKSGVNLSEDPQEILSYPEEVEVPPTDQTDKLKKVLTSVIDYARNKEITPEEFKNFCIWATRVSNDPMLVNAIVVKFVEMNPLILKELQSTPDGGKYGDGLEVLSNKFRGPREM